MIPSSLVPPLSEASSNSLDGRRPPFLYMGNNNNKHQEEQVVPKDVTSLIIHSSVKVIPRYALKGCRHYSLLLEITFQKGVQVIGDSAFQNCTSLESVHLSSSVKSVGTAAFLGCLSLKFLTLNHGLKSIGCAAFCGCMSLTTVSIPGTVEMIREAAFLNCVRLHKVLLLDDDEGSSSSLRSIGNLAFANCDSLLSTCPPVLPTSIISIGYQALLSHDAHDDDDDDEGYARMGGAKVQESSSSSSSSSTDQVKLNARRELEIHRLQDELEQLKLENAQLLVQLETTSTTTTRMTREKNVPLKLQSNWKDGLLSSEEAPPQPGNIQQEEKDLSMMIYDQHDDDDLEDMEAVNDLKQSSSEFVPPTNTRGGAFQSCLKDAVKMLIGAPIRLSIKKFAELDALMAAHHQQQLLMERQGGPVVKDPEKIMAQLEERDFQKIGMEQQHKHKQQGTFRIGTMNDELVNHCQEEEESLEQVDHPFQAASRPSEEPTSDTTMLFEIVDHCAATPGTNRPSEDEPTETTTNTDHVSFEIVDHFVDIRNKKDTTTRDKGGLKNAVAISKKRRTPKIVTDTTKETIDAAKGNITRMIISHITEPDGTKRTEEEVVKIPAK